MSDTEKWISALENMYRESLKAMNTELTALLEFTYDFKGEESSQRLMQAQELIRTELKESR